MQKLMIFIEKPASLALQEFRQALLDYLHALQGQCHTVRYAMADEDIAPAGALAMRNSQHPADAVVSLYPDGEAGSQDVLAGLAPFAARHCCYRVEERSPLVHETAPGRVAGMCQIALLKRPASLSQETWLDIWLNSHTQVAIDTQSTFSYRQNIVFSATPADATPLFDAIVEEQFPSAAMTDRAAFFNAPGDEETYKANEKAMVDSVMRFVDLSAFECFPLSEYRLK